jgi:hypothetical protein
LHIPSDDQDRKKEIAYQAHCIRASKVVRGGGERTKRAIAMVLLIIAIASLVATGPAGASSRYWAQWDLNYYMGLLDENGQPLAEITYPANTPFWMNHGFTDGPWKEVSEAEKEAFMGPAMYFELWIDGELQKTQKYARYLPEYDLKLKLFPFECDYGMTGIHEFEGKWYADGYFTGGTPGEAVLSLDVVSIVTFT